MVELERQFCHYCKNIGSLIRFNIILAHQNCFDLVKNYPGLNSEDEDLALNILFFLLFEKPAFIPQGDVIKESYIRDKIKKLVTFYESVETYTLDPEIIYSKMYNHLTIKLDNKIID